MGRATSSSLPASPLPASDHNDAPDGIGSALQAINQFNSAWLNAQQLSLQLWAQNLLTWKAWQEELWDEWRARFCGGAAIDV